MALPRVPEFRFGMASSQGPPLPRGISLPGCCRAGRPKGESWSPFPAQPVSEGAAPLLLFPVASETFSLQFNYEKNFRETMTALFRCLFVFTPPIDVRLSDGISQIPSCWGCLVEFSPWGRSKGRDFGLADRRGWVKGRIGKKNVLSRSLGYAPQPLSFSPGSRKLWLSYGTTSSLCGPLFFSL